MQVYESPWWQQQEVQQSQESRELPPSQLQSAIKRERVGIAQISGGTLPVRLLYWRVKSPNSVSNVRG